MFFKVGVENLEVKIIIGIPIMKGRFRIFIVLAIITEVTGIIEVIEKYLEIAVKVRIEMDKKLLRFFFLF